ncbi:hypothetical protein HaLaN_04159, partial [Haematococcus lacustris]
MGGDVVGMAAGAVEVAATAAHLRQLQQQVAHHQALASQLQLDQQALREQCAALHQQLEAGAADQAAARLQLAASQRR